MTSLAERQHVNTLLKEAVPATVLQAPACAVLGLSERPEQARTRPPAINATALSPLYSYSGYCHANFLDLREQAIAGADRYKWTGTAEKFLEPYYEPLGNDYRLLQGVKFDTRSGTQIIKLFDETVKQGRFLQVVIANANTLNIARAADNYRALLRNALVLNDGIGVSIASQLKYSQKFSENLNGTDFIPRYLAESRIKLRVFLLGAPSDVAKACFEQCRQRFPQHEWLGFNNGYLSSTQHHSLCERIREMRPDVLLVGMGNPLQEFWIRQYGTNTGAKLCIGVGGLFDFLAGKVNRAPSWVRRLRCEWVYRLVVEPRRMWRRYLIGNITFFLAAWRESA
ncbi:MAG TPA: WecB/TagA/CpsF family glycosyltransferase [Methylobacter sp.]|jgi:alpha-1,3-mannosyltransferase